MEHTAIRTVLFFLFFLLAAFLTQGARAAVNVFSCEPEWTSLAQEIGGDKLKIFTATTAKQDPHHIRARPRLISQIRRADLVICSGAELEVGWLPLLLERAAPSVQNGQIGNLTASDYVLLLEKSNLVDRAFGDIHPSGNPHIHLNPHNMLIVAEELTTRLSTLDASNASYYRTRAEDFTTRFRTAIVSWEKRAAPLKGQGVIVHHRSFTYLTEWLGMRIIASLEPKPGIPPTPRHLAKTLAQAKADTPRAIIRAPYDPKDGSLWFASRSGIPALVLPYTTGDVAPDLFQLFEQTITLLIDAK